MVECVYQPHVIDPVLQGLLDTSQRSHDSKHDVVTVSRDSKYDMFMTFDFDFTESKLITTM